MEQIQKEEDNLRLRVSERAAGYKDLFYKMNVRSNNKITVQMTVVTSRISINLKSSLNVFSLLFVSNSIKSLTKVKKKKRKEDILGIQTDES